MIAPWLRDYSRSNIRGDVMAAVTVWALLVPQGLAYGQLAGLPAVHGLYAALGALGLYWLWGTSRHLNVGPEATVATLVVTVVTPLASGDPEKYLTLAAILAVLTGVALVVGGLLKLGVVTRLLSTPVLVGYITGSALVIIGGQLDDLLGITIDSTAYHTAVGAVAQNLDQLNSWDAVIGSGTIVALLLIKAVAPKAPSYLIVVVLAISGTAIFGWDGSGATVVGTIEGGLPVPAFGAVALSDVLALLVPALAIGLLAYVDSIATVKAVALQEGYEVDPNREFYGLAAANIGAGVLQGFSVNGSQSRSFTSADAGARSQVYSWVVAGLVLVTLLFLTRPFEILPTATLAGIVIVVGIGLIDVPGFRRLWRIRRTDFLFAAITTAGVVALGMLAGVFVAVLLSLLDIARRALTPHTAELVREPGTDRFRDSDEVEDGATVPGLVIYRFDAPLIFANVEIAIEEIDELVGESDPPASAVVFSAEAVTDIDVTAIDALAAYRDDLNERGLTLVVARLKAEVEDQLEAAGVLLTIANHSFLEVDDAVEAFGQGDLKPPDGLGAD
ncbi:MAG: SulP family inorganic anion transporter [Acidimicrobiia bacterium]